MTHSTYAKYNNDKLRFSEKRKDKAVKKKLKRALSGKGPENTPPLNQISLLLEQYQKGRFSFAEPLAIAMTEDFPKHPVGWQVLGALFQNTNRISASLIAHQKAAQLAPNDPAIQNTLGDTLFRMEKFDRALKSFKRCTELNPNFPEGHYNLGVTLLKMDNAALAEPNFRRAVTLDPNHVEAHYNLGNTLKSLGKLDEAEASYRRTLKLRPDFAGAQCNLGNVLEMLGRSAEAESCYRLAIENNKTYALAYCNLATTLQRAGKLKEARDNYNCAIKVEPKFAEAHRYLALLKKFESHDDQFEQMEKLVLDKHTSEKDLCHLYFGLAKASEDLKDFELAYNYYCKGNILRKKSSLYNLENELSCFGQIKKNFIDFKENAKKFDIESSEVTPIFIVGMPRSGTSLTSQVISSHSYVTGGEELPFVSRFGSLLAREASGIDITRLLEFRARYLKELNLISDGHKFVIDKMPLNFRYLGLLSLAFPEAKIIHVTRSPEATCWGNFKQYFASQTLGFTNDLQDIVTYFQMYTDLMKFWKSRLGNNIYNLNYDSLVNNQETETRSLISHIGLSWEHSCLFPESNRSRVNTASSLQIRRQVFKGSSDKWKQFKPFLNGILDGLEC